MEGTTVFTDMNSLLEGNEQYLQVIVRDRRNAEDDRGGEQRVGDERRVLLRGRTAAVVYLASIPVVAGVPQVTCDSIVPYLRPWANSHATHCSAWKHSPLGARLLAHLQDRRRDDGTDYAPQYAACLPTIRKCQN